jgi:hypothetical protein
LNILNATLESVKDKQVVTYFNDLSDISSPFKNESSSDHLSVYSGGGVAGEIQSKNYIPREVFSTQKDDDESQAIKNVNGLNNAGLYYNEIYDAELVENNNLLNAFEGRGGPGLDNFNIDIISPTNFDPNEIKYSNNTNVPYRQNNSTYNNILPQFMNNNNFMGYNTSKNSLFNKPNKQNFRNNNINNNLNISSGINNFNNFSHISGGGLNINNSNFVHGSTLIPNLNRGGYPYINNNNNINNNINIQRDLLTGINNKKKIPNQQQINIPVK